MALRALTRLNRGRRSKPRPFVSPVGGLNRRDALAGMPEQDAFNMDNFFPSTDAVETRKGFTPYQPDLSVTHVETLIPYNSPVGNKLLAITDGDIRDVSVENLLNNGGIGPELVVGGTGDSVTGWADGSGNGNTLTAVNGRLRLTGIGDPNPADFFQTIITVNTKTYAFSAELYAHQGNKARIDLIYNALDHQYFYATDPTPNDTIVNPTTNFTLHIQAADNTAWVTAGEYAEFDNISIKEIIPPSPSPTIGANVFPNTGIVQWTMFVNAALNWLIMVNGADTPQKYDGTTLSDSVITGVTGGSQKLVDVFSFKGRLYFAAVGQAGFYYLGLGNVQGAASYFDLGQVASRGGSLQAITSITRDGGSGPDDYIVFIMDTGEYIVYQGSDPSDANNWSLVGRYFVAPPIGRKCHCKYGGDTLIITESGLVSFNAVVDGRPFNPDQDTITYKLGTALSALFINKATHGWFVTLFPAQDMLIFNVPTSNTRGSYYQFIMNTRTGSWCRFVGLDNQCWAVFNGDLYGGDFDGNVWKVLDGFDDNGQPIRCSVKQAYSRFDEPGVKKWNIAKLILSSQGAPAISVGMSVDFKDTDPNYATAPLVGEDSLWDIATWDVSLWGAEEGVNYFTQDIDALGFSASISVKVSVKGDQVRWYATEHIFELGGLIGDTR